MRARSCYIIHEHRAPPGRAGPTPDQVTAVLQDIEARGWVVWEVATGRYVARVRRDADHHARADAETVALLMTYLRSWSPS